MPSTWHDTNSQSIRRKTSIDACGNFKFLQKKKKKNLVGFFVPSVPLADSQRALVNTHATLFTLCAIACRVLRFNFTGRMCGHRCLQWLFAGHALTWKASVWERSADRSRSKKGKILEETHDFIDPHSDQSHSSIGFANWCANDISQVNPGEPG
jgi:hypothetical protein